jgi:CBS domain-containing protein
MKLKDLCVLDAVCCLPDITIAAAARAMRQNHVGDLIVIDDADEEREPIGMITDRDIVLEVIALGRDPNTVKVREVMTTHVVIASADEDATTALERMRSQGVRRLPVVDEGGFVMGIVALDDLLRLHAEQAAALAQVVSNAQVRESRGRR